MKTYKGISYETSKDSYDVFDYGKLTNTRITIAGGSGIANPEERAMQVIDEIVQTTNVGQ